MFTICLLFIINVNAQISDVPNVDVPFVGNVNPDTGLPSSFEKYRELADNLSKEEARKAYLKQEWTKLLANNKNISPILFYTEKFFSYFDPLWNLLFGLPFSWSWMFILCFVFWIVIIVMGYMSIKAFFTDINPLINLLIAFCIASLMGTSGGIREGVNLLTVPLKNIWTILVVMFLVSLIVLIYYKVMEELEKDRKKKTEEIKKEMRKEENKAVDRLNQRRIDQGF